MYSNEKCHHPLWGEINDVDKRNEGNINNSNNNGSTVFSKKCRLDDINRMLISNDHYIHNRLKIKDPLLTQTIEVKKQTEMLTSLIDTYSNKSGSSNYLLNPCPMIPEVDFPPENAAELKTSEHFQKPIWFMESKETSFYRGEPLTNLMPISRNICRVALRKVICGQLSITGFTDTAETALILYTDVIEEFIRNFIKGIDELIIKTGTKRKCDLDISVVNEAYKDLTNNNLVDVHNYFKQNLIIRNCTEIVEFKSVLEEYDQLMKESQSIQHNDYQDNELFNILEMPTTTTNVTPNAHLVFNEMLQDFVNANNTIPMANNNVSILKLLDETAQNQH